MTYAVAMMKIAELLQAVEQALRQGARTPGADAAAVEAFASMLADFAELPVEEFCRKARDGLARGAKAKKASGTAAAKHAKSAAAKPKPAKPAPSNAVSEPSVLRYSAELDRTRSDSRQFEAVVERMKKDKEVRIGEAREIARRFLGSTQSYKSKPEAAKAILQRQITDIRAEGKAERIADIF
jgi:hypothetical protein